MQQITNALELFNAANDYGDTTPESVRTTSYNHAGHDFDNKPQFIAMDSNGAVFTYGLNPTALTGGRSKEGDAVEMEFHKGGWHAMNGVSFDYIGTLKGELRDLITSKAACFRIDDSFYPLASPECSMCNGHGCVAELTSDERWEDIQCPDCDGTGKVSDGEA